MSKQLMKVFFFIVVTVVAFALGLLVIRLIAPDLLNIGGTVPADIRLVQLDDKVPPFFRNVFNYQDVDTALPYRGHKLYLKDPLVVHRPMPLLPNLGAKGPHDVLGFRNLGIPNRFEVMTMGDSMTYGSNVRFDDSWPSQMEPLLAAGEDRPFVYNVSLGGWCAMQYYHLFEKMLGFEQKVVVIAHYMGNDSIECFRIAYSVDFYRDMIPNAALSRDDLPKIPKPKGWRVKYADGKVHVLGPEYRMLSNARTPVVDAGYEIMKEASRRMSIVAAENGVKVIYTLIPTQETVVARKIANEGIEPPQMYTDLVQIEQERIRDLASFLDELPSSQYVDVLDALQQAVMGPELFYLENVRDGHPIARGYGVIAKALAPAVRAALGNEGSPDSPEPQSERFSRLLHIPMDDSAASPAVLDASRDRPDQIFLDPGGDPSTNAHSVPGVVGKALAFDGVDDSIIVPDMQVRPFFEAGTDFSVAFWWRSDSDPFPDGNREVLRNYTPDTGGIILYQRGDADGIRKQIRMEFYVGGNGAPLLFLVIDTSEDFLQWHHYIFQREGETLRAWRDGELVGSYTAPAASGQIGSGVDFRINSGSLGTMGAMDDLRIYPRALSESEIHDLSTTP